LFSLPKQNHLNEVNVRDLIITLRRDPIISEYLHIEPHITQEGSGRTLQKIFDAIDTDNSSSITWNEFEHYFNTHTFDQTKQSFIPAIQSSNDIDISNNGNTHVQQQENINATRDGQSSLPLLITNGGPNGANEDLNDDADAFFNGSNVREEGGDQSLPFSSSLSPSNDDAVLNSFNVREEGGDQSLPFSSSSPPPLTPIKNPPSITPVTSSKSLDLPSAAKLPRLLNNNDNSANHNSTSAGLLSTPTLLRSSSSIRNNVPMKVNKVNTTKKTTPSTKTANKYFKRATKSIIRNRAASSTSLSNSNSNKNKFAAIARQAQAASRESLKAILAHHTSEEYLPSVPHVLAKDDTPDAIMKKMAFKEEEKERQRNAMLMQKKIHALEHQLQQYRTTKEQEQIQYRLKQAARYWSSRNTSVYFHRWKNSVRNALRRKLEEESAQKKTLLGKYLKWWHAYVQLNIQKKLQMKDLRDVGIGKRFFFVVVASSLFWTRNAFLLSLFL